MLKYIRYLAVFIALCLASQGRGQLADTVIDLSQVTISAPRVSLYAIGQPLIIADSLDMNEVAAASAGDILSGMTSIYLRNYGAATLTTVSVRGTSSNHTGLIWNGIRLSPPNIGYVDLSMIRADFFDDISLLYGGASSMYGSGSIGGAIHLNSVPEFSQGKHSARIGASYGSFGQTDLRTRLNLSSERFSSRTAAFYNRSDNDFQYEDLYGNNQRMSHGGYNRFGATQDFAFRIKDNQTLTAVAWFQYSDRNIPPTLTESASEANQVDRSARVMVHWKQVNPQNYLEVRAAYFNDFTRYTDPRFAVYSTIFTQSVVTQVEGSWTVFNLSGIYGGISHTFDDAELTAYGGRKQESSLALFGSFLQPLPSLSWKFALHLRQEFLSYSESPFTFGLSSEGKISGPFSMQVSVSKNFRTPTMNERYWEPGGDPGLMPELSWNGDLSLIYRQQRGNTSLDVRITGFTSLVDNWILWMPGENYWSAENVRKVWARGAELTGEQVFQLGLFSFSLKESYTYSRSTNENELQSNDDSYKKQLIYTPLHKALLKVYGGWKGFGLTLRNSYTGVTYTTRDNELQLPAYYLLDLVISKRFRISQRVPVDLTINANNILNAEYLVTPYRPMPGFNMIISLNFELYNFKDIKDEKTINDR